MDVAWGGVSGGFGVVDVALGCEVGRGGCVVAVALCRQGGVSGGFGCGVADGFGGGVSGGAF